MCTNFLLAAELNSGNVYVNGRSMEYGLDLGSQILIGGVGTQKASTAPDGNTGVTWTATYGYVGLNAARLGLGSMITDGMNSAGLAIGGLWLPTSTQYQTVTTDSLALDVTDFANWALGRFATVAEVTSAVNGVQVWGATNKQGNLKIPLHFAVSDANGDSIVIEYLGGALGITTNPVGVLTNEPPFTWHLSNIANYVNLKATDAGSITINGTVYPQTGHGSGMLGLPGDSTPPSRFIRALLQKQFAMKRITSSSSAADVSSLALHVLNTVDIPHGASVAQNVLLEGDDYTQWAVVKVLSATGGTFSYRTYNNPTVCQIDLSASGLFSQANEQAFDLPAVPGYVDVTSQVTSSDLAVPGRQ
jgi:choloylglycine hydrolase